ncbi:MerR family transcriptional regulator [Bailinhaonella thermotolerans]|uniref:MerR family transcriptional regulator n=1 Tax=Bailinhaonella thermotolerans TaxID=1070861 RepID=A0A3A4AYI3_9ACTN|nr:MerR family transcriptional regulator [Bailinhaonella thermotolerans]RJL35732.1 MerR family transcriptional regulator [Bailinhaonella thermotolerans]
MHIGELSRRTGVSERLLRYYEKQGLLWPERSASGYRHYQESDVDTVLRIRRLLAAGLNTETIALVMPCVRIKAGNLVPVCPEVIDDLRRQRDRLTQAIEDLQASRDLLDAALAAAPLDLTA